jgi:hypothetical protein
LSSFLIESFFYTRCTLGGENPSPQKWQNTCLLGTEFNKSKQYSIWTKRKNGMYYLNVPWVARVLVWTETRKCLCGLWFIACQTTVLELHVLYRPAFHTLHLEKILQSQWVHGLIR